MKSMLHLLASLACICALSACGGGSDDTPAASTTEPSAYSQTDTVVGTGPIAAAKDQISVHYTGWLYQSDATNLHGPKFDSSVDRGTPFSFTLGTGDVIAGWDKGVVGMQVGGKRTLVLPSNLAYGSAGQGAIPPNAGLIFDIELLSVTKP